jgi:catechol-2,3-dioxygenase
MRVLELRLFASNLPEIRNFYGSTLEFPVLSDSPGGLVLSAGATRFVFEQGDAARYHVAFNIPENQFAEAKQWTAQRVPLMTLPDGFDQIHWKAWNAHALYFLDPAGNIMEFIARHNLPTAAADPFSARSIQQVSEIGLPVPNVSQTSELLQAELGLRVFDAGDGESFIALGDDNGLFITVKQGRAWFPTADQLADFYPLTVTVRGETDRQVTLPGLPYRIEAKQTTLAL